LEKKEKHSPYQIQPLPPSLARKARQVHLKGVPGLHFFLQKELMAFAFARCGLLSPKAVANNIPSE